MNLNLCYRPSVSSSRGQYRTSSPLRQSLLRSSTDAYTQPLQLRPSGRVASTAAIAATNTPVKAAGSSANTALNSHMRGSNNAAMMVASPTLKAYLANSAAASTSGRGSSDRIAAVQGGLQPSGSGRSNLDGFASAGMQPSGRLGHKGIDRYGSVQSAQRQSVNGGNRPSKSLSSR